MEGGVPQSQLRSQPSKQKRDNIPQPEGKINFKSNLIGVKVV